VINKTPGGVDPLYPTLFVNIAKSAREKIKRLRAIIDPDPELQAAVDRPEATNAELVACEASLLLARDGQCLGLPGEACRAQAEEGRAEMTDELLGGGRPSVASKSLRQQLRNAAAVTLLTETLADGPKSADQIQVLAAEASVSWRSVQRASMLLKVVRSKSGTKGGWTWALPATPHEGAKTVGTSGKTEGVKGETPASPHPTCLAAYGYEVPDDGLMHGVPHRD
jgi:hypothetical protein